MNGKGKKVFSFEKFLKKCVCAIVFFVLGRALQSASKHDIDIKKEISVWRDGFKIKMFISPNGPSMLLEKKGNRLKYVGAKNEEADLVINYKNIECAFMVLTPQKGIPQAFAEHRMSVVGYLGDAMIFTRCINIVLCYLYPRFINKRLLRRVPSLDLKKQLNRFVIYLLGIPFGM